MPRFLITETVEYLIEADDEDHAEQILLDADDPNDFFVAVRERLVEEDE